MFYIVQCLYSTFLFRFGQSDMSSLINCILHPSLSAFSFGTQGLHSLFSTHLLRPLPVTHRARPATFRCSLPLSDRYSPHDEELWTPLPSGLWPIRPAPQSIRRPRRVHFDFWAMMSEVRHIPNDHSVPSSSLSPPTHRRGFRWVLRMRASLGDAVASRWLRLASLISERDALVRVRYGEVERFEEGNESEMAADSTKLRVWY